MRRRKKTVKSKSEVTTEPINTTDSFPGSCEEHIMEIGRSPPPLPVNQRAHQKRKSKKEVEEISNSEVVSPLIFCSGDSSKRRVSSRNLSTQPCSQPTQKLDTNLFDFYLESLWKNFSEEKKESFAYLDCLWFSLYTTEASKAKVLNWIKRKHIFSKKYVFVPIVRWCHWSLLIFCNFGQSLQSQTTIPCMLLLDSLQMMDPQRLEPGIRKFVADIFKTEELEANQKMIRKIPLWIPKVPQQRNGDECGTFVLYYINQFVESAPKNISTSDYRYFMKEDWVTLEGLECFIKTLDQFASNYQQLNDHILDSEEELQVQPNVPQEQPSQPQVQPPSEPQVPPAEPLKSISRALGRRSSRMKVKPIPSEPQVQPSEPQVHPVGPQVQQPIEPQVPLAEPVQSNSRSLGRRSTRAKVQPNWCTEDYYQLY